MNRILFFAHFDKYGKVLGNIYYLLRSARHSYDKIVFISNSPISDACFMKLESCCDTIITRGNRGFDFGAWKEAIQKEGWDSLSQFDSVTLMNDSCIAPIYDLRDAYIKMGEAGVDFWGITLWQSTKDGMPGTNGPIPEHIQSYFMCFNKSVIQAEAFQKFWKNVENKTDIIEVIQDYETQLTALLSNAGFKYSCIYALCGGEHNQDALYRPDLILKNKIPFLKKKSLAAFPYPEHVIDLLKSETDYPVDLISEWANETLGPNQSLRIHNKLIPAAPREGPHDSLSVAIHLHVYYMDIFESMIEHFEAVEIKLDLYITTDTADKKERIRALCLGRIIGAYLKDILVFENRGRDILPWLSISDVLGGYDVVGKFHAKKAELNEEWQSETWLNDMLELLLVPAGGIVVEFAADPKLGVVIPDLPTFMQVTPRWIVGSDFENARKIDGLWKRMGCSKEVDFGSLDMAIAPFGSMLWYRPAALRSLFDAGLGAGDFPPEPIGRDFTMAHCVEHVPVYCAWNDGFDYRIATFSPPKVSGFVGHARLATEAGAFNKNSKTYKAMILLHNIARETGMRFMLRALFAFRRKLRGTLRRKGK